MIGRNVGTPQGHTKFLTLLDWQEPGWQLDGPMTHCGGIESHMTTAVVLEVTRPQCLPLMQFWKGGGLLRAPSN